MGCTHELSTKTIYFFVICDFFSYVFEAIFLAYGGFKPGTLGSTIGSPSFDDSVEIMTRSFITSKNAKSGVLYTTPEVGYSKQGYVKLNGKCQIYSLALLIRNRR